MHRWHNWSGGVVSTPRESARPAAENDVVQLLRRMRDQPYPIRVVGSGHSFTPLCATDGLLVEIGDHFEQAKPVVNGGVATLGAGLRIANIGESLHQYGVALPTQGDIDRQTIAGAISTGTHGTGLAHGSLSAMVTALRILLASGDIVDLDATHEAKAFNAARLSLGSLGIILDVSMQVVPSYRLRESSLAIGVDDCVDAFPVLDRKHRHVEFFWVPGADRCALKILDGTNADVHGAAPAELPPPGSLERYLLPERVDWSHRVFPSVRSVRFNEMEFAVSYASGLDCFREIRDLMRSRHSAVRWSVEVRSQKSDDIPLSPAYGQDVITISIHQDADLPYEAFFRDAETVFRNYAGRPHWAKRHFLTARELRELYPEWDRFLAVRDVLDPQRTFMTPYLETLLYDD